MKAIQITEFGGPEVMTYVELPDPTPNASQTLLTVEAVGINFADTHQIQNSYLSPQKLPMVPGLEVVGRTPSGQRVLAPTDGGYAQLVAADTNSLIPIPDGVSDGAALAMMVQGSTAFHILKTMGHVTAGESVVIHAAAGGVGTIAIQLAKMWGAFVIAVTSTGSGKADLARSLGADVVVDAESPDLLAALLAANGGRPVDLVLEMVGGATFEASLAALAPFGRLVTYGMASRVPPRPITSGELMHGSKTVSGFWLVNCFGHPKLLQGVIAELFDLIVAGKLTVTVGSTYPLSQARQAHEAMLARKSTGKILLDPKN